MRVEAPAICGAIFLSSCFFIWMDLEPVNVKDLPGLLRNSGPDTLNWSELAKLHGSYFPDTEKCVCGAHSSPCPSCLAVTVPWCCHPPSPALAITLPDPSPVLPSQLCPPLRVLTWPDGKSWCS